MKTSETGTCKVKVMQTIPYMSLNPAALSLFSQHRPDLILLTIDQTYYI